jgi:hypothetical protein
MSACRAVLAACRVSPGYFCQSDGTAALQARGQAAALTATRPAMADM